MKNVFSNRFRAQIEAWQSRHESDRGFRAEASGDDLELNVLDFIGFDPWFGGGITTDVIKRALDEHPDAKSVRVVIDSPGGSVFDGIGILNALRRHPAKVTTEVIGLAASAASVIFMAGDHRVMNLGTELMIHQASGGTWGTADDHESTAKALRSIDSSLVDIYESRTGLDAKAIKKLVDDETWLTAKQAVEQGWADFLQVEVGTKAKAPAPEPSAAHRSPAAASQPSKNRIERPRAYSPFRELLGS